MSGSQGLQVIKAYAQCFRLNKDSFVCQQEYQRLATDYQHPRCVATEVNPRLGIYAVSEARKEGFERKAFHRKRTFYLSRNPGLNAKDVQLIVFNQSTGETVIKFNSVGDGKMREFSEKNKYQMVALALGEKLLTAPMNFLRIFKDDGVIEFNSEFPLYDLCMKTKTLVLPDDAKIP
ncbi:MAG: hypothetical protein JNK65_04090 [Deltaproteobacteria bacterium]|nr:hypothetical protein [Deltaproteobacteria bacterium]